jgi:hypothetical protein
MRFGREQRDQNCTESGGRTDYVVPDPRTSVADHENPYSPQDTHELVTHVFRQAMLQSIPRAPEMSKSAQKSRDCFHASTSTALFRPPEYSNAPNTFGDIDTVRPESAIENEFP